MSQIADKDDSVALYLKVWGLLFVLSTFSYLVDFFHVEGYWRWGLVLCFMLLKAGLIVSVFMHLAWERLALKYSLLLPPLAILVLIILMSIEGNYTYLSRINF